MGFITITDSEMMEEVEYGGVNVDLTNVNKAKEEFRKVVDLEPEVFNGVLVW